MHFDCNKSLYKLKSITLQKLYSRNCCLFLNCYGEVHVKSGHNYIIKDEINNNKQQRIPEKVSIYANIIALVRISDAILLLIIIISSSISFTYIEQHVTPSQLLPSQK